MPLPPFPFFPVPLYPKILFMNCPSCGHENIDGIDRCENCLAPFRDLDVPRADSAEGLARSVMEDNLSQLDPDNTIYVAPDTPVLEVARLMKNANCGCALVLKDKKLVGIFTEHDVLLRMTGKLSGEREFVDFHNAAAATGNAVEPAVLLEEMPLNEIPSGDIPIEELRADALLVTDANYPQVNDAPANLTTADDLLVKDLMSPNPETLHEQDSVAEAVNKMSLGRYRHIPFVKSDGTYAVASIKSVLKYIAREDW